MPLIRFSLNVVLLQALEELKQKLDAEEKTSLAEIQKMHDAEKEKRTKDMKQKHDRVRLGLEVCVGVRVLRLHLKCGPENQRHETET